MSLCPSPTVPNEGLLLYSQLPEKYLACLDCAKSKSKCDRRFPCSRCAKKGIRCRARLMQRGPGRSTGSSRSDKQSPKSGESARVDLPAANGTDTNTTMDDIRQNTDSTVSLSDLDQNTSSRIDDGLLENEAQGALDMGGPSYVQPDATKEDQYLQHCLNTLMQNNYLDMTNFQAFPQSLGAHNTNDSNGVVLSHSQSPNYLSADAYDFMNDIDFPIVDQTALGLSSMLPDPPVDESVPGLEGWPFFECNPITPLASCPTTAREHLKNLYNAFNLPDTAWDPGLLADHAAPIEPLIGGTRDKLIAIMQSFSNKAQRIHGLTGSMHENFMIEDTAPIPLILPPPHALDTLLSACLRRYEIYYPFLCAASLKTNKPLDAGSNAVIASLKLLLMLAAGAMTAVTGTTHQIAHGLLEIGRISFCHLIEEDIKLAANPDMLQCALGYIIVAAWCGDKWQMDMAIYQKAKCIEMLRRSKFFEQRSLPITTTDASGELENSWQRWQEQESLNRTAYTWVILDQEMCLFQDSPLTLFALVTKFDTSVPNPDSIWRATSAGRWAREMAQYSGSRTFPPSLNDYFRRFRETPNVKSMTGVTPVILRLLLCHLQDLVGQVRKMIEDTSSGSRLFSAARHKSMVLVSAHLDEASELLQKWYTLAKHSCIDDKSPTKSATMILYGLVVLNTLVSFPEVERLAQGEDASQPSEPSRWKRPYHFDDHRRIYFHCGQILRTIQGMPEHTRPAWWAGAVYRVALTAWANSMAISDADSLRSGSVEDDTPLVVLDDLPPEHPLLDAYLDNQKGTPVLSTTSGGTVSLDIPNTILTHLASFLGSDPQTDFIKGIRQKLLRLAARWEGHVPTPDESDPPIPRAVSWHAVL